MKIYEELQARGLIAQVTDEEEIRELVNNGKATFYIGFDPTADSLHVGHFMALCLMKRLQMAGNKPIALIGGGTGYIGDPSGRSDMRSMMTAVTIQHNCDCFKKQMERFIDFSDGKALMVNNAEWLLDLNYIDFLREVGPHFSVNRMLTAECYKQRMEKGLSFLEFNYMIMQSYDFYMLYQKYGLDSSWNSSRPPSSGARMVANACHRGSGRSAALSRQCCINWQPRMTASIPFATLLLCTAWAGLFSSEICSTASSCSCVYRRSGWKLTQRTITGVSVLLW